jgi:hypothetical protein
MEQLDPRVTASNTDKLLPNLTASKTESVDPKRSAARIDMELAMPLSPNTEILLPNRVNALKDMELPKVNTSKIEHLVDSLTRSPKTDTELPHLIICRIERLLPI